MLQDELKRPLGRSLEYYAWRHMERFAGWYRGPEDFWLLPEKEQYRRMNYESIRQAEEQQELMLLLKVPQDD